VERNLTSELNLPNNNSLSVSSLALNPMNTGPELFVSSASASNASVNVLSTNFSLANQTRIQIGGTNSNLVTPYGSPINVAKVSGPIKDISVTLNNFSHDYFEDVNVLLVAPNGQGVVLMSDVGDGKPVSVKNQTLTFSDAATDFVPRTGAVTGAYKPTNYITQNDRDLFPNPAPQLTASSSYRTNLSAFNGIDPSGTWNLYVVDTELSASGDIAGGWSLNFSIDGLTTNEDQAITFSRSNNNSLAVSNVDPRNRLQVNLNATNGVLSLKNRDGIAFVGNGTNSLTMISSITNINAALDGLQFTPTPNFFGTANLEMVTKVLGATEETTREVDRDSLSIRITSENDAPENRLPGNLITEKNNSLVFSTNKGNAISITDADAQPGRMFVSLTATNGTVSLSENTTRLNILGNNTESVIITGSLADVNAALNGMSFNPIAKYIGDANIQISTYDNGNTGLGGEKSDVDILPIYVSPIMGDTDFNDDNTPDILMRNKRTGENRIWQVDKNNIPQQQSLSLPKSQDNAWKIEGTADFNNDGKLDFLWRNSKTGENVIWLMNGNSQDNSITITAVPDADWKIQGLADFDNDRKMDILWRNNRTGENAIWLMDGTTLRGGAGIFITQVSDISWQMQGVGDFDGDGKTDILWRYYGTGEEAGKNAIWLMDGTRLRGGEGIYITRVPDTKWEIQGVADFDRDGKMDILWRNYGTGENGIWLMERTQLRNGEGIFITRVPDLNWRMQGIADFDGDGYKDILWRNYGDGQNAIWVREGAEKKEDIFITREQDTDWEFLFP
jgi:subtilisin-like proprotein convertase family protein